MGWFSRNRDLEKRLEALERDFKALELDWGVVYDKIRKSMNRMVKSRAIIEERAEAEQPADDAETHATRLGTHPGGLLTPRQKEIQQAILRRRAGG